MTSSEITKIRKFISDPALQEVIKKSILSAFMKRKEKDVPYLAAQMLAIQFLEDAWKELLNYKEPEQEKIKPHQTAL